MVEFTQNSQQYIRYRDIVLQRAKEYREKNKEKIKSNQIIRYKNVSQEEKNNLLKNIKNGLIDKLKKNKRKWKEKQESMQKIDIITI